MKDLKNCGKENKMANRKAHCKECKEKMGEEWDKVHAWLDGLSSPKRGYLDMNHRRWRHHEDGVEEVRLMWGDEAAKAAEMHIITDFGSVPTRKQVEMMFDEEPDLIAFSKLNGKG